ncbi:MAG: hypothetical protein ACO4CP_03335 [Steroidobacteraceae bacterium]
MPGNDEYARTDDDADTQRNERGCRQVAAKGRVLSRFQDLSDGLPAVEQIVYFASPCKRMAMASGLRRMPSPLFLIQPSLLTPRRSD